MIKSQTKPNSAIFSAVNKLVEIVSPTFGPAGSKVIIPNNFTPNNPSILDDGVMIAKEFQVQDEFENSIINVIKQVAIKTNDRVGDGTTGSLIILGGIMDEIQRLGKFDTRKITEELKHGAEEAKNALLKQAKKITKLEDLEKVARISFDNPEIAKVIADLIFKVGHEGVVTVQESNTMEISSETVDGIDFDKGYVSPYMVTNPDRLEAELINPVILLTDYRLTIGADIIPILTKIVEAGHKNIVIIADETAGDPLAIAVVNKMQGKFNTLCINTPGYDSEKTDFLTDLAAITGATVISQSKGMKLDTFDLSMLGKADKVVSKQNQTLIIGGKGKKSDIQKAISMIKVLTGEATGYRLDKLVKRLARLQNGIAVIKVGAPTEHEMRALKYKVEDAVNAVKVAYKSGIVAGGGNSLMKLVTSSEILNKALQKPISQLHQNSGVHSTQLKLKDGFPLPYNVVTDKSGDFIEIGIIDPVEVLIAQIESAVSIANLLITTSGIIVNVEEKKDA